MVVSVLILEEGLSIKSFSNDKGLESLLKSGDKGVVIFRWVFLSVEGLSSGVVKNDIN